jgi:hypothetical protein
MGFVTAFSPCFSCGRPFSYNPRKVPSFEGEPICGSCMDRVNEKREEMGLVPHPIQPDAYEPLPEEEL